MKTAVQLLISIWLFASGSVFAQDTMQVKKEKPAFKLGVYYNSNLNYYGRTDSLRSNGFFPIAELWFTSKFYVNAAPVFVNNKVQHFQYAGTVATIGYRFVHKNKFTGHLYAVKPFYQSDSKLVQSALKAQLAANFTWLNKFINFTVGGDMKFSDKTDYGAAAGLDHIFKKSITKNVVLAIDPSAYIYAGTQYFTKSYLSKSGGFLFLPGSDQLVTESTKKFSILSYELSAPVVAGVGKFQFLLTPAYVIPENLVTAENQSATSETGSAMLYVTAGAKINF